MKLTLREQLSQFSHLMQTALFPALEEQVGRLDQTAQRLVAVLEMIPLERFLPCSGGWIAGPSRIGMRWPAPSWPRPYMALP